MAYEILRLFKDDNKWVNQERIIVMGGHVDGIITFGKNLEQAFDILIKHTN